VKRELEQEEQQKIQSANGDDSGANDMKRGGEKTRADRTQSQKQSFQAKAETRNPVPRDQGRVASIDFAKIEGDHPMPEKDVFHSI
jgi:hypothetical protein